MRLRAKHEIDLAIQCRWLRAFAKRIWQNMRAGTWRIARRLWQNKRTCHVVVSSAVAIRHGTALPKKTATLCPTQLTFARVV